MLVGRQTFSSATTVASPLRLAHVAEIPSCGAALWSVRDNGRIFRGLNMSGYGGVLQYLQNRRKTCTVTSGSEEIMGD